MGRKTVSKQKTEPEVNLQAGFNKDSLPAAYQDDQIEAKQKAFEERGPVVEVITDEWEGQLEERNPYEEAAEPFVKGNPDKHFRYLSELQTSKRGKRGYQEVRKNGQPVKVGTQTLAFIPREVHERRQRKVVAEAMDMLDTSRENYREQERRAAVDSGGSIIPIPDENEIFEGNRRVAR
ncbi:MAG TPA: hypothetical protein VF747_17035 [Blastocatellia bacterium]|jgi:hypothetical protein